MKTKGKGPPSTDLLVCFPTRAHLTLMPPKPICSPNIRPQESTPHHHRHPNHHHHHHHRRKRSIGSAGPSVSSPVLWAKNKPINTHDLSEPTSPKVTCAGQIKIKPKPNSCKNWQSVMEEIERIHNGKKNKKKPNWIEAFGIKKDAMQFLTCLRNIRFDFRCFGAFPATEITSDEDDDDDDDEDDENDEQEEEEDESSRTVFSKWFMVLQEENSIKKDITTIEKEGNEKPFDEINVPPKNALLLMRCRSAPAKSWLEEKEEEEQKQQQEVQREQDEKQKVLIEEGAKMKMEMEEKIVEKSEDLILRYGADQHDFYKFSSEIAKETWVVGGIKDSLSRSRSWKS